VREGAGAYSRGWGGEYFGQTRGGCLPLVRLLEGLVRNDGGGGCLPYAHRLPEGLLQERGGSVVAYPS